MLEKKPKDVERPFLTGMLENKALVVFLIIIAILFAVFIISITTDVFGKVGDNAISSFFNYALDYMLKLMGIR